MKPWDVVHGRFELEILAGADGMGEVFRARDRMTGGVVALKLLPASPALDTALAARMSPRIPARSRSRANGSATLSSQVVHGRWDRSDR
jgi:hypothetical protein